MQMQTKIDATGDVVVGDQIEFIEGVFVGSYKRPRHVGDRTIIANVVKDSYGSDRQQHTFTLVVIESSGHDPVAQGSKIRRKGRNVYRNGVVRQRWDDESLRDLALDEKHMRGDAARHLRAANS